MSAKDRYMRESRAREARVTADIRDGMARMLDDPSMRAAVHEWLTLCEAEGPGTKALRKFGRELTRAFEIANWNGVQIMREEYRKPRSGVAPEPEQEGEE